MSSAFNIPAGFALVPLEPNAAMEEAGEAAFFASPQRSRAHWAAICGDAYRAMIAVAPPVDAVPGEPVAVSRHEINTHANALRGYIDSLSGDAFQGAIRALNVLHDSFDAALASPPSQPTGALSEPVAWMTHHDEPMLFPTWREAALHCGDDEEPIPLYTAAPQVEPEEKQ